MSGHFTWLLLPSFINWIISTVTKWIIIWFFYFIIIIINSNNKAVDKVKVVSFNFHTVLDLIINKFYLITTALHHNNLPNRSKICSKNTDQSN